MLRLGEPVIFLLDSQSNYYGLLDEYMILGFFACGLFKVIFINDFEIWKPFILLSFPFFSFVECKLFTLFYKYLKISYYVVNMSYFSSLLIDSLLDEFYFYCKNLANNSMNIKRKSFM